MNEHPTESSLRALVRRTLDALAEERALLEHLEWCDECFQTYEELWARASGDRTEIMEVFVDSATSRRLERRIFRRVHVASLGTASSWLATEGFVHVLLGVLLPILDHESAPGKRVRGEQP